MTEQGEQQWRKVAVGDKASLVVGTLHGLAWLFALPEWLIDRILADHAAAEAAAGLANAVENLKKPTEHDYYPRDYITLTVAEGRMRALAEALQSYRAKEQER